MPGKVGGEGWKPFPRYVAVDVSGCEVHVHFRACFVNGSIASDWCATFNSAEDWFHFDAHRDDVTESGGSNHGRVRQTVLVDVGKLVELPKEIMPELLPSVVRLQPFDFCLRGWRDAPKHVKEFGEILVGEDGELGFTGKLARQGFFPGVGHGKIVGQVVEGG